MGHYDSCYEADNKAKVKKEKQFIVVLSYKTPHLNGNWAQLQGKSIREVLKKLDRHVKECLRINKHIHVYEIDEIKFHFKYIDIIS